MHSGHKVAHCCHGSLNCGSRAREKPGEQRRVLKVGSAHHSGVNSARLDASKKLKAVSHFFGRDFYCPLTASFSFKTMGLIDYPMPDRRQNFTVSSNVSEQQRVVGHHNI